MFYTYVLRPADAPEGKGPQFKPFWDDCMNYSLRLGTSLMVLGYFLCVLGSMLGGNLFQIFQCLNGSTSALSSVPVIFLFVGCLLSSLGALSIQNFRSIADDDASISQSRGFRAGIKALHQGSLISLLSHVMTAVLMFSFMKYFEDFWVTSQIGGSSVVILASVVRGLSSLSLIILGVSFFLLESYHSEGTSELWSWTLGCLYKSSGILEFLCLISTNPSIALLVDVVFTLTLGITLIAGMVWAMSFEPLVNNTDVKLTQSAMRNEFYKSKNAQAYYGPPAGIDAMGI